MIKAYGIDFVNLPDDDFDKPLGFSTGAGTIFGTTGGVMEATLRTAYEKLTGNSLQSLDYHIARGVDGLREASVQINGTTLNVAVANGLENAKRILEKVKLGEKQYHIIEIMACPGGCVSGGGQPIAPAEKYIYPLDKEIILKRQMALYNIDSAKKIRKSHENPYILKLYEEYLGQPGSIIAHKLLHTTYHARLPKGIK